MAKRHKVKLVLVEWIDSVRPIAEWQYLKDYEPLDAVHCVSVGFLIHSDKNIKCVAPNMGDISGDILQVSGIIHIPSSSILKIVELEEKNGS